MSPSLIEQPDVTEKLLSEAKGLQAVRRVDGGQADDGNSRLGSKSKADLPRIEVPELNVGFCLDDLTEAVILLLSRNGNRDSSPSVECQFD